MTSEYSPGETIYIGRFSLVRRAIERATGEHVVLKTCVAEHPMASDIARIHNEWNILRYLDSPFVVRAKALVGDASKPVLVLADQGAATLRALMAAPLDVATFFTVAKKLGAALESVHAARVVHRDIKPDNVLFDAQSGALTLVDFNISIHLSEHREVSEAPELMAGTLPYLAPEQTGRTGRTVDERADLYSAGAMFYELLTGRLPFVQPSALEVIHQHLTATPPPSSELAPGAPASVHAIIERLMAKNPDERYQSARGFRFDIERAERAWRAGDDDGRFELGSRDVSDRLHLPDDLYGREHHLQALETAGRRAQSGAALMVCLSGGAGSGKSSLVRAFARGLVDGVSFVASSRCDEVHRAVPHKPILDALRGTLQRILGRDEKAIAEWAERIRAAVGDNGAVLMDVLPELAVVLGQRPALPQVGLTEASNRFRDTLRALVQCFARPGHPLVLFIDDLQWADSATLDALRALLGDPAAAYLLVIAAYRESDEDAARSLEQTLSAWREARIAVEEIEVRDLGASEVARLLADTLRAPDDAALASLARVVHDKTHGNPFAVRQFVTALHRDRLLSFDDQALRWTWDQGAIAGADIADNVVELLVARMRALPPEVQEVLQWIACLGSHAGADALMALAEDAPLSALAQPISVALQNGLLATTAATERLLVSLAQRQDAPLEPEEVARIDFSFPHDRVRQAAYALIPEAQRAPVHLRTGRLLYARTQAAGTLDEHLFDVTEHFRKGAPLLFTPSPAAGDAAERSEIVALALASARRARAAGAYQAGLGYARFASGLLPADPWSTHASEAFAAGRLEAECLSLIGDHAAADALCQGLGERARTSEENAALHDLRIEQHIKAQAFDQANELVHAKLALFGVSFPRTDDEARALIAPELDAVLARLGRDPEAVVRAVPHTDSPTHVGVTSGLMGFFRIGYLTGQSSLATLATVRAFSYSLEHGLTTASSYPIGMFGFFSMQSFGQWDLGITMGRIAAELAAANTNPGQRVLSEVACLSLLSHWHRPLRELVPAFTQAIERAARAGAHETLSYAIGGWILTHFFSGENLLTAHRAGEQYFITLARVRVDVVVDRVRGVAQGITRLTGLEFEKMPQGERGWNQSVHVATSLRCALHVPSPNAELTELMGRLDDILRSAPGGSFTWDATFCVAMHSLCLAQQEADDSEGGRARAQALVESARVHTATLQRWADGGNVNLGHKLRLLDAEFARHQGRYMDALESYVKAMKQARAMEHSADEALAAERAASLCESRELGDLSRHYLSRARAAYDRWGALVKVRELDAALGLITKSSAAETVVQTTAQRLSTDSGTHSSTSALSLHALDIESVVKAALAIGREIKLPRLLFALMRVLMENAGADRAAVLMTRGRQFTVAAEARSMSDISVYEDRPLPVGAWLEGPQTVARYVMRTRATEVLGQATEHPSYGSDPYIRANQVRSLVCLPIEKQGELVAAVYLENRAIPDAFTRESVELLQVLAGQIAISLENARLYSELEDAMVDLASSERLKHEFLATVSHELRTPLNAIINMPEVLLQSMPAPGQGGDDPDLLPGIKVSEMRDMLETVQRSGQNLLAVIEQMILFTRLEAGILPFNVAPLAIEGPIAAAIVALEPEIAERRASVHVDTGATSEVEAKILGDRHLVRVIVQQLIANAIKFSPEGCAIHVRTALAGPDIELSVRDSGSGIPEEARALIFESFRQGSAGTKRARGGTGLGLTITKKLVDLFGGSIAVHSSPGAGTEFTVRLPAAAPPEPHGPPDHT